jgi:hypothetical protein
LLAHGFRQGLRVSKGGVWGIGKDVAEVAW